jgi:uncharacterized membrane protein (UPF0127 family)
LEHERASAGRWTQAKGRGWKQAKRCCQQAKRCYVIAALAAASVGVLACNHVDTPRGQPVESAPSTTQALSVSAPKLAPSSSAAPAAADDAPRDNAARCVTPWPKTAAPRARAAAECPSAPAAGPSLPEGVVQFVDAPSQPQVAIERALDDDARTLGLMYRTHMQPDNGMLFSWDAEEVRSFWMRNTCIPLDMLFIARDGTIVGILEQVPTLNTLPRSVPCPAQHVLELNAGWAREHGVEPGQHVRIET